MRLEQEIREICIRVILAKDSETLNLALADLRTAMRDHAIETQNLGIHLILTKPKIEPKKTGTTD